MRYGVISEMRNSTRGSTYKEFNSRKDALKYAYQKAKNYNSDVRIGISGKPTLQGRIICIKNKRFYVAFKKDGNYGREYTLYSDGTLGE